jgi:hypothetical protein
MAHQEGTGEGRRCAHQGGDPIQFRISMFDFESNLGSRTTSPSNCSIGCIRNQIWTFYICTEKGPDKLSNDTGPRSNTNGIRPDCENNVNIPSPTCPGVVHIKTDAQVAYDIQLGCSWTPWKGKEKTFTVELQVPRPNSFEINGNHQNNLTSRICLGAALPFLAFGPCILSNPIGLRTWGTCVGDL